MLNLMMIVISIGSSTAMAQLNLAEVCENPALLKELPPYMTNMCAQFEQRKMTYTVTNDRRLIVKGTANGEAFTDVYDFPTGSSYSAKGREVIIHRPEGQSGR